MDTQKPAHMFIAAFMIIAKTWNQLICPLVSKMDKWINCGTPRHWNIKRNELIKINGENLNACY